jgi:hypothetical protein
MMPDDKKLDAYVAGAAQALGLSLDTASPAAIQANLAVLLQAAALFDAFPLPDDAEPGPVFRA